jgi:hypothetical protein
VKLEREFRYCPWCAAPQRRKLVEFFRGVDADERKALRVSRYLPEHRVRFSVWDETGTARAAVSLDDDEAARLAAYLAPTPPLRQRLRDDLRALVRR